MEISSLPVPGVADMHERCFQFNVQRIGNVEMTNLVLLWENTAMSTRILTLSKAIETNKAARNRHLQYLFLTAGEQLVSSVLVIYQQVTPMHVDLMRSFAYWRAVDGTRGNGGGKFPRK